MFKSEEESQVSGEIQEKKLKKQEIDNSESKDFTGNDENSPVKKRKIGPKKKKKKSIKNTEELQVSGESQEKKSEQKIGDSKLNDENLPAIKFKMSQNDINAERRVENKLKKEKKQIDPEEASKTLFVGNVPVKVSKKKIQKFFKKYGEIESIRIRGIAVADPKIPKKTAAIKKEFHPNRNSVLCYIRYYTNFMALIILKYIFYSEKKLNILTRSLYYTFLMGASWSGRELINILLRTYSAPKNLWGTAHEI